jgi:hypothetical protein
LFESLAVGFIKHAMSASKHLRSLFLSACGEAVDVSGNVDLLAQGQVLDTTNDGFDDGHLETELTA